MDATIESLRSIFKFVYGSDELSSIELRMEEDQLIGDLKFLDEVYTIDAEMEAGVLHGRCSIEKVGQESRYDCVGCHFVQNRLHGSYSQVYGDRLAYEVEIHGQFVDGLADGEFVETNLGHYTLKYIYQHGKREGPYTGDYGDHPYVRGTYRNDLLEGEYLLYHRGTPYLSKYVSNYQAGKEDGIVADFDEFGEMIEEAIYQNGVRNGITRIATPFPNTVIERVYEQGRLVSEQLIKLRPAFGRVDH